ncbi:MAG: acyl-CoA dehydrogenase family protein [Longimicrobiales bacterium]
MQQTMDALQEIRTLAEDFAAERLRPHVERWDHERAVDPAALESLAETGFAGMLVPEPFGGLDLGLAAFATAIEALAWGDGAVAFSVVAAGAASTTLLEGARDSHGQTIEAIAEGAPIAWPLAHSAVRASSEGRAWRVDGSLDWVVRTGENALALVPATADEELLFLVPADLAGSTWTRETTLGLRPARLESARFDGAIVPADACVAHGAQAAAAMIHGRQVARLGIAAIATGIARAALEHATRYAAQREQFGQALRTFEGLQFKLADMATRLAAANALLQAAALANDRASIAIAKLVASEAATWVTREAVQIFGGYGYMRDYPVEKLMRDAKAMEILGSTNEDLRVEIAATLYDT